MSRACFASTAISSRRRRFDTLRVRAGWLCLASISVLGTSLVVACGAKTAANAESERGKRDTKIRPESCSKSAGVDVNRDGKKDLHEVVKAGKVACRTSDLDLDGMVDQTSFYDASGVIRRREVDLDGNGVPNMVEHYKAGKLVLREIDGANLGRFDMWDAYDPSTGQRTTRERDTNGDGRIDQYWTFAGARITVRFDRNEDGIPDEEGALVWGEGFDTTDAGAPDAGPPAAPLAQAWTDAGTDDKPLAAPEGLLDAGAPRDGGSK